MATVKRKPKPAVLTNLSETVYQQVKADIFDFRLKPGARFSENELAVRLQVSRTPVREALYKLQREGYINVLSRSGWRVREFDFQYYEDLYDVRIILELAAVRKICKQAETAPVLNELKQAWLVARNKRLRAALDISRLDERFHDGLMEATGNTELRAIHAGVTDRIRIIRRLDFSVPDRIDVTYEEHGQILRALIARRTAQAEMLLRAHIEASKAVVRQITLHALHTAQFGKSPHDK